jgi:hypothetical protein
MERDFSFNPLNAELNPICHLLALLGVHPILHVSRISVQPHKLSYSVLCTFYIKTTTFFCTGFHQHTLWCTGFNGWKGCTHTKQQSINICEPCYSGIWSIVMTHFNTTVSTMCDCSNQPHSWQVTSPIAVLFCRSLSAQSSSVYHQECLIALLCHRMRISFNLIMYTFKNCLYFIKHKHSCFYAFFVFLNTLSLSSWNQ